jgi:hypothetical protein
VSGYLGLAVLTGVLLVTPLSFAQSGSETDLSGTWVDRANSADKITVTEAGDSIQMRETDGDKVVANYKCTLDGKQCESKEEGRSAKVMTYYNGPKLIEIIERGSDVTKRRFSLSQDGKTLVVETMPLTDESKVTTRTFQKQGG